MASSLRGLPRNQRRKTVGVPTVMVTSPPTYLEAEVNFKKGLRGRFQLVLASLEFNSLSVYQDSQKKILLKKFTPPNSWISSSSRSESGLFIVNVPASEDPIYLFETGSDLFLQTWLRALSSAGWKSALVGKQHQYSYIPAKSTTTAMEHQDVQARFQSDNGEDAWSISTRDKLNDERNFVEQPAIAIPSPPILQRQRSQSLPMILPIAPGTFDLAEIKDPRAKETLLSPDTVKKSSSHRNGVAIESGYCSKESLLMDGDKILIRNQSDEMKTLEAPASSTKEYTLENFPVANYDGMVQDDGLFLKLDKVSAQAPSINQQIGGADLHKNAGGRRSPTSPSTPSTDRSVASYVSTTTAEGVTYQGVKLEKKQSMSQIISQLKTRFGSSSTRKKGKKAAVAKKPARHDTFSSRLLWNPSGRWHDNWFVYQDGVLSGYKDVGFKPAEVLLDLKTCKLTSYSSGSAMRQLNLFKLTTGGGLSHFFLAWSDDIYETWLEILSCLVRETSEFGCRESKVLLHAKPSNESDSFGEGLVIPYESSFKVLANERIAQLSHSSENSGNDGDESGLESSITPSAVDTYQSRSQQQRQRMRLVHEASPGMMAETSEPEDLVALKDAYASPTSLVAVLPANLAVLPGEAKRHESKDATSTSASTTDGDGGKVPAGDVTISEARVEEAKKVLRAKRPLLTRHRHSYIDPGERNRALAALARPHSNGDKFDVRIAGVDAALLMGSSPRTLKSPALNGNHSRGGSQDSSLSEMVWDALLEQQRRRVQKTSMGSEDDDRSVHSRASDPFDEERFPKDGDDLPAAVSSPEEDKLREELLLRKRRNSLTLERGTVQARLQALRSSGHGPKRGKSVDVIDGPSVNKAAAVALTGRLEEIDSQIDSIDMKIRAGGNSKPEKVTKKLPKQQEVAPRRATTGSGFITKFRRPLSKSRLSPHGIDVSHYVSVESLASTGSRDSKDSHRESPKFRQKLVAADKDGTIRPTELRYTRAIGSCDYSPVAVERVFSQIDVDDGVEYPALDKNRSKSMSSLLPWVLQQNESHDSQTMDALQKIEDFEKFSAILSNRMTQRTRGDVIDV